MSTEEIDGNVVVGFCIFQPCLVFFIVIKLEL